MSRNQFLSEFGKLYDNFINQLWNKLYESKIIKGNNLEFPYDVRVGEDLLFNLSYFEHIDSIQIESYPIYHYMQTNTQSITKSFRPDIFNNQKMLNKYVEDFLINNDADDDRNLIQTNSVYLKSIVYTMNDLVNSKFDEGKLSFNEKNKQIKTIIDDESTTIFSELKFQDLDLKYRIFLSLLKNRNSVGLIILLKIWDKLKYNI